MTIRLCATVLVPVDWWPGQKFGNTASNPDRKPGDPQDWWLSTSVTCIGADDWEIEVVGSGSFAKPRRWKVQAPPRQIGWFVEEFDDVRIIALIVESQMPAELEAARAALRWATDQIDAPVPEEHATAVVEAFPGGTGLVLDKPLRKAIRPANSKRKRKARGR